MPGTLLGFGGYKSKPAGRVLAVKEWTYNLTEGNGQLAYKQINKKDHLNYCYNIIEIK